MLADEGIDGAGPGFIPLRQDHYPTADDTIIQWQDDPLTNNKTISKPFHNKASYSSSDSPRRSGGQSKPYLWTGDRSAGQTPDGSMRRPTGSQMSQDLIKLCMAAHQLCITNHRLCIAAQRLRMSRDGSEALMTHND